MNSLQIQRVCKGNCYVTSALKGAFIITGIHIVFLYDVLHVDNLSFQVQSTALPFIVGLWELNSTEQDLKLCGQQRGPTWRYLKPFWFAGANLFNSLHIQQNLIALMISQ